MSCLEDLDFADVLVLLSNIKMRMQTKVDRLNFMGKGLGLRINVIRPNS